MLQWIKQIQPDILTLQEVRAPDSILSELLDNKWHVVHAESQFQGRAGVAILSRARFVSSSKDSLAAQFVDEGRWVEATIATSGTQPLVVISAYVPTGDATQPAKMQHKHAFMQSLTLRLAQLKQQHELVLLTGDLNIAHTQLDIKNWKGNLANAGFLPRERAYFDALINDAGWVDIARAANPGLAGPYTWWSWRGQAFNNDAGWRIDYQIATPKLAERVLEVKVDKALSYEARWSDHAPVIVKFDL